MREFVGAANKALQWVELRRRADELDNNKRYIIVKSEYKQVQIPIDKNSVYRRTEGLCKDICRR